MSKRKMQDWIDDIHLAMRNIEADMRDISEAQFLDDGKTIRAVVKSITDIGEASHQLMDDHPEIKAAHPDVWLHLEKVYAMRIKVTHGYFGLDAGVVWSTVKKSLPAFECLLDKAITLPVKKDDQEVDGSDSGVVGGSLRIPRGSMPGKR